jgi:hypothetical protein
MARLQQQLSAYPQSNAGLGLLLHLQHTQSTSVTTTTLDNLIEQECDWISQNKPTALVIDTQGAEAEVIQK